MAHDPAPALRHGGIDQKTSLSLPTWPERACCGGGGLRRGIGAGADCAPAAARRCNGLRRGIGAVCLVAKNVSAPLLSGTGASAASTCAGAALSTGGADTGSGLTAGAAALTAEFARVFAAVPGFADNSLRLSSPGRSFAASTRRQAFGKSLNTSCRCFGFFPGFFR